MNLAHLQRWRGRWKVQRYSRWHRCVFYISRASVLTHRIKTSRLPLPSEPPLPVPPIPHPPPEPPINPQRPPRLTILRPPSRPPLLHHLHVALGNQHRPRPQLSLRPHKTRPDPLRPRPRPTHDEQRTRVSIPEVRRALGQRRAPRRRGDRSTAASDRRVRDTGQGGRQGLEALPEGSRGRGLQTCFVRGDERGCRQGEDPRAIRTYLKPVLHNTPPYSPTHSLTQSLTD